MSRPCQFLFILIVFVLFNANVYPKETFSITDKQIRLKQGSEVGVVQRKAFRKLSRFEFTPLTIGTITNDPFIDNYIFGMSATGHLSDQFGIELQYLVVKATENDLNRVLQNDYGKTVASGKTSAIYNINVLWTPMYGKLGLFNKFIVPTDTFFTVGLGSTRTHIATSATFNLGLGQRFYLNNWLACRWDLRDYIHQEQRSTTSITKKNIVVTLGLSMFYPAGR